MFVQVMHGADRVIANSPDLPTTTQALTVILFFFSSRRRHTRCRLVTGVQTCALPIRSEEHTSELQSPIDISYAVFDELAQVDRSAWPTVAPTCMNCLMVVWIWSSSRRRSVTTMTESKTSLSSRFNPMN